MNTNVTNRLQEISNKNLNIFEFQGIALEYINCSYAVKHGLEMQLKNHILIPRLRYHNILLLI